MKNVQSCCTKIRFKINYILIKKYNRRPFGNLPLLNFFSTEPFGMHRKIYELPYTYPYRKVNTKNNKHTNCL